jgi:formylglycine-generating enzyme required for sulfatase activity
MMKNMRKQNATILCGLLLTAGVAQANNLRVANVSVTKRDDHTAFLKFDISWENSWRHTNINHDAAWVFFKVRQEGSAEWQPVMLEGSGINLSDYSNGVGTAIDIIVPSERMGLFVRRAEEGSGILSVTNVQAVWNFSSNSLVKTSRVFVQTLAVEMVYVAQGNFAVGNGSPGFTPAPFTLTTISTNDANVAPSGTGSLGGMAGGFPTGQTAPNALWPNGYSAFYCMKYDVTEGQWVDFFNTLTDAQKTARDITGNVNGGKNTDGVTNRNTVAWTSGGATSAAPDRVCAYFSWGDEAAFADWAGLRPMTELEFEKACRGPLATILDEYAWGSAAYTAVTGIMNAGLGTETATGGNCNNFFCTPTPKGPYRAGIFATATSSRISAGASYWGIMDLSGNVWKMFVTVDNATGRAFTGVHGDGKLNASGDADVTLWPGTSAVGTGSRGGHYNTADNYMRVAERRFAASGASARVENKGIRAVRTAPSWVTP